ncbi:hypothetical protein AB1E18_019244 [Capra hircus]
MGCGLAPTVPLAPTLAHPALRPQPSAPTPPSSSALLGVEDSRRAAWVAAGPVLKFEDRRMRKPNGQSSQEPTLKLVGHGHVGFSRGPAPSGSKLHALPSAQNPPLLPSTGRRLLISEPTQGTLPPTPRPASTEVCPSLLYALGNLLTGTPSSYAAALEPFSPDEDMKEATRQLKALIDTLSPKAKDSVLQLMSHPGPHPPPHLHNLGEEGS